SSVTVTSKITPAPETGMSRRSVNDWVARSESSTQGYQPRPPPSTEIFHGASGFSEVSEECPPLPQAAATSRAAIPTSTRTDRIVDSNVGHDVGMYQPRAALSEFTGVAMITGLHLRSKGPVPPG